MKPFDYEALPNRVIFGVGRRLEVGAEADRLEATRILLIADAHDEVTIDEISGAGRAIAGLAASLRGPERVQARWSGSRGASAPSARTRAAAFRPSRPASGLSPWPARPCLRRECPGLLTRPPGPLWLATQIWNLRYEPRARSTPDRPPAR